MYDTTQKDTYPLIYFELLKQFLVQINFVLLLEFRDLSDVHVYYIFVSGLYAILSQRLS